MGIVPLLKGRMRGGGMQPLRIIRPIYCRDKFQTENQRGEETLGKGFSLAIATHLITRGGSRRHRALRSGPSYMALSSTQRLRDIESGSLPILRYYCQHAELKATWLSDGDGPILKTGRGGGEEGEEGGRRRGGGRVCKPFWLPSHSCQPCINT